jgi:hypothetical protein
MKKSTFIRRASLLFAACILAAGCCPPPPNPLSSKKDITSFQFLSLGVSGTIVGTAINVRVLNGTDVTALAATFTTTGVSVAIGPTPQESGVTVNNFTATVPYTVTAADGTTKTYTVVVFGALDERRYLPSPTLPLSGQFVANNEVFLNNPVGLTNPFPDNSPVVFVGGVAPVGISAGVVYYAQGSGTSQIRFYALTNSAHPTFTDNSQVGTSTVYQVDWTVLHVGPLTPSSGVFALLTGHGLTVGDGVYLAATPGNATLASGSYVVATVPDATTFTLTGASITPGDSVNYLAKIGSGGGTTF